MGKELRETALICGGEMMFGMVLNDLSLQTADNVYIARQWMSELVQTIKKATSYKVGRVVRTQSDIFDLVLTEDYPLRRWINDQEVDRVARQYVKSLTTKAPYWDDLPDLYEQVNSSAFEFEDREACGLGVAYLLDSIALSLHSEDCWNAARLSLSALFEANEEITMVSVIHASQPGHIDSHQEWIKNRLKSDIKNGEDLWQRRAEILPSIEFCDSVESQIASLNPTMLRSVVRRLLELDFYCRDWTGGGFDPDQLPARATVESQATLQQFGDERTFQCPDGIERVFSWHIRVTPGNWRIHFYPKPETRRIVIGYVGRKLSTVRYHH